ncbi:hypothetical protein [Ancylobacter sp. FA202]|uniref:hypothetical protein n=1 Tax=Ancylobacter sp. FA202 TaxID=1111106 RepID=UPI0003644A0A|nr:hypothetical protein [Ancylobacter sp. FA202]
MRYLIFDTVPEAQARNAQAWLDCGYEAAETYLLWPCIEHPDGRAALMIVGTPEEAQIGLSQDAYDALLTNDEIAASVVSLSPDWFPSPE